MELRRYFQIMRRRAWMLVMGTLLAAGAALIVSAVQPPLYRAVTSLVIYVTDLSEAEARTAELNRQMALTYREVLTTGAVLEAAAASLGLDPAAAQAGISQVDVWVVPDTTMMRVAVEAHDPDLAAGLANEMVSAFLHIQQESTALGGAEITVVQPAKTPTEPVAPRIWLNTLLGAMGGFALSVGMALLLEYLGSTSSTQQHALDRPGAQAGRSGEDSDVG